jgi:glycosyltransferase involved in cell wall biosynthesis
MENNFNRFSIAAEGGRTSDCVSSFDETISFVIPAYNEEARIGRVLDELCSKIEERKLRADVIVMVDGNDGTEGIVLHYSSCYPFVRYFKNCGRNGKGAAVRRSLPYITGKYVMLMDADNSVSAEELFRLLDYANAGDVIIANRYAMHENNIPALRRFLSYCFNILVRASLGIRVRDTQSGYKLCKSDVFVEGMKRVGVTNTFFDVSFLYHLKLMKKMAIEVPVKYTYDERSTFSPVGEVLGQGVSLLSFRIRHSRFSKYVPDFARKLYFRKFRWI